MVPMLEVAMTLPDESVASRALVVAERFRSFENTLTPEKVLLSERRVEEAELRQVPLIAKQPVVRLIPPPKVLVAVEVDVM